MLTDLKARNLKPGECSFSDGTVKGLRLHPGTKKGQGKWIFRFTSPLTFKRRDMGLGVYPVVGITDARKKALAARELISVGKDPIEARNAEVRAREADSKALTFEQAARKVHDDLKPGWHNPKHQVQWIATLKKHVFPVIGKRKVKHLKASDFADVLRDIWTTKPETASRIKQRCNAVMDWCIAQEIIETNPVGSVTKLLHKQPGKKDRVNHQPAMPWPDIPAFVEGVLSTEPKSLSKLMLEFLILTASRSGEVRAMTWEEVDFVKAVWTVPAERMKGKTQHRVPLSERALEILTDQKEKADHHSLVFPSPRGKIPSDMILTKFLRDKNAASSDPKRTATAHGFRSSFRDWASENGYSRDLAERALAHTVRNEVEAAYHRTDLLEQRRKMMDAWSSLVCGQSPYMDNVISINEKK